MITWIFTNTPLHYFTQSFWRDEAFSYLLAKRSLWDNLVLNARDFSPPLYTLILHYWIKVFGSSEIALRSFSLVSFVALAYVFYLFLISVLKIKTKWAYVYLLLFFLNPFLNYYAFEARPYMLFAFFAFLSFYYLYEFRPIKYFVVTLLGLLTHYFMLFVLAAQILFALTARSYKSQDRFFQLRTIIRPFIFFIPWLVFVYFQHKFTGQFWITKPPTETFFQIPAIMFTGYESVLDFYKQWLLLFSLILILIIIYGVWQINKKRYTVATKEKRDLLYLFLSWSIFPAVLTYLISFVYPVFLARYLIFSAAGMILLLVFMLEQVDQKTRWLFFIILLIISLHYNVIQVEARTKAPLNTIVKEIKGQMQPSDVLYVTDELNFHPAEYYLDENRVFVYGKTYAEIPQYVGKVIIPQDKIINSLPLYPRKAFILKDDLTYNIEAQY